MPFADLEIIRDPERLNALRQLMLLDSPTEVAFDRLTQLAARIFKVPVSLISLVDSDRQFFKSQVGLPEPWASMRETPLTHSFCQHVVATGAPLIIADAREHPLVFDNLAIPDMSVIAYLGMPLKTSDGHSLGSYCVIDDEVRAWSDEEIDILRELAALVMTEIELRKELIEHQKAQRELQEKQAFINRVTTAVPDTIYIYDLIDGHVDLINRSLSEILGYDKTIEADTTFMTSLLHPDDQQQQQGFFTDVKIGDNYTIENESRMKHANGEWHWFLRRESVFTWTAEGKPHLVLGTSRDITAQKQTQALAQQLDNEKQRVQLLSHFIHDTSHDFRTPITIMRSSIELLKRMPDRDTQLEKIAKIEHYLDYLVLLLDQHQYMALLDSESALSMSLTDINGIVSAVVENSRARHANKTLNFNLELQSPLPKVMCDISTLSRAVSNLLDNATAFTPEGGSITARTWQDQQQVMIEISDTGKGISESDMDHIFERLYKGDDARGLSTGGAGLGLPIVKRIVELHQGDIEVYSAVGEGSTFRLILPLNAAPT